MARRYDTISFLSDLGLADEHVGVVKAVVRDLAPHARVVDLTHADPAVRRARRQPRAGSRHRLRAVGRGDGVVDAGERRARVAIEVAGGEGVVIGPDNGLLASAIAMAGRCRARGRPRQRRVPTGQPGRAVPSRDVFAPVAAHLCNGVDLAELGTAVDADTLLPGVVPLPREARRWCRVHAEVLWIDRRQLPAQHRPRRRGAVGAADGVRLQVTAGEVTARRHSACRGRRPRPGSVGLVVDGYGLLTLALDRRSAGRRAGARHRRPGDAAAVGRWRRTARGSACPSMALLPERPACAASRLGRNPR
jgi:hypothetical protein